jgi:hypothetical protein
MAERGGGLSIAMSHIIPQLTTHAQAQAQTRHPTYNHGRPDREDIVKFRESLVNP